MKRKCGEDVQRFKYNSGVEKKTKMKRKTQSMKGNMETMLIFQIMYWNYISGIYTSTLIVEDEKGETISNNSVETEKSETVR